MPYLETNNHRIFYNDTGSAGDGKPAILFSHGYLMDHEMWSHQVDALHQTHRCIAWDEPGFGQTEPSGEPFDFWQLAGVAFSLLDELGIDSATWCGMSQGGFISMRAALADQSRVDKLVLVNTSPYRDPPETVSLFEAMFEMSIENGLDADLATAIAGFLFGPDFDPNYWQGKWRSRPPSWTKEAFTCLVGRDDISDRLSQISCPALVIHGELDTTFAVDDARDWSADLGSLTGFLPVPGAGHTSNLENPRIVNDALLEFLGT